MKLCAICEEPISELRLAVLPNTRVCLECQNKREANGQFRRSRMEVSQTINGWQFEELEQKLIKGEE